MFFQFLPLFSFICNLIVMSFLSQLEAMDLEGISGKPVTAASFSEKETSSDEDQFEDETEAQELFYQAELRAKHLNPTDYTLSILDGRINHLQTLINTCIDRTIDAGELLDRISDFYGYSEKFKSEHFPKSWVKPTSFFDDFRRKLCSTLNIYEEFKELVVKYKGKRDPNNKKELELFYINCLMRLNGLRLTREAHASFYQDQDESEYDFLKIISNLLVRTLKSERLKQYDFLISLYRYDAAENGVRFSFDALNEYTKKSFSDAQFSELGSHTNRIQNKAYQKAIRDKIGRIASKIKKYEKDLERKILENMNTCGRLSDLSTNMKLASFCYYSALDLTQGYNQILVELCEYKTLLQELKNKEEKDSLPRVLPAVKERKKKQTPPVVLTELRKAVDSSVDPQEKEPEMMPGQEVKDTASFVPEVLPTSLEAVESVATYGTDPLEVGVDVVAEPKKERVKKRGVPDLSRAQNPPLSLEQDIEQQKEAATDSGLLQSLTRDIRGYPAWIQDLLIGKQLKYNKIVKEFIRTFNGMVQQFGDDTNIAAAATAQKGHRIIFSLRSDVDSVLYTENAHVPHGSALKKSHPSWRYALIRLLQRTSVIA